MNKEIKRLEELKKKTPISQWLTSQMRLNLEREYAKEEIIKEIKNVLFESIKECKGETFEIDIGEYNKIIHSAHELEDIFMKKLKKTTASKPKENK